MASWFGKSVFMANLDYIEFSVGTSSNEYSFMGSVQSQLSKVKNLTPMQNNTQESWEERFDEKFKDSFTLGAMESWEDGKVVKSFIRALLSKQAEEISEAVKFLGKEQIELYKGKLPFIMFMGKADEQEKIAIYRQALSDSLLAIKQIINK